MGRVSLRLVIMLFICSAQKIGVQVQNVKERQGTISATKSLKHTRPENVKKGPLNSALDVLSGQSTGVNVITNGTDRLTMLNSTRVRGTTSIMGGNDPLVIIDGVTSDIVTLSTMYPADTESFTILKDATETAIYGSRGASGVIKIKAKKGTRRGLKISYDDNYGFESMYKHLQVLNGPEYMTTAETLGLDYSDGDYNTSFHDVIARTGLIHQHYLAFSSGSENSNYRASFGFMDHNTIVKVGDYRNLVVKLDATQKAFDGRLVDDFGICGYSSKIHDIFDIQMLFHSATAQSPTYPVGTDVNDNWVKNSTTSHINRLGTLLCEKNDFEERNSNTHLRLKFGILGSLILSAFSSYSYSSTGDTQLYPTWVWAQGNVYHGEFKDEDYFTNVSLSYNNAWGDPHLDAVVGAKYLKQVRTGLWVQAKEITANDFSHNNIETTSSRSFGGASSNYEDQSFVSIMDNVTYSYRDGCSIAAALRGNGSPMVNDNNTFGFFPSVSLGQDVKKESFLSDADFITMLKLRTGYGRSGNLGGITFYTTLNTVEENGIVSINGIPTVTIGNIRNTNPDLKRGTHSTFDIGFDLGVWDNRLMLTSELYYLRTTGMLYEYNVPVPTLAFDKLTTSVDSMSNQSVKPRISVVPTQRKDMEMSISFSMSYQRNKLLSLNGEYNGMYMTASDITPIGSPYGADRNGGDSNVVYQIVGQPLGTFYLPHYKGLKGNELGDYSYDIEDLNDDGEIDFSNGGDRYIAGQATSKATIGSNISFYYESFDIAMQINGVFGHKIFNSTGLAYTNMSISPDYSVLKGAPEKNIIDQNVSDYWSEKGDCVNIEHITIGYNTPMKPKAVKSLRLSAGINNLATITGYNGLTPMINSYVISNTLGIDDKRACPLYRTYSLGLSIQF